MGENANVETAVLVQENNVEGKENGKFSEIYLQSEEAGAMHTDVHTREEITETVWLSIYSIDLSEHYTNR